MYKSEQTAQMRKEVEDQKQLLGAGMLQVMRYRAEAEAVRQKDFQNWIISRDKFDKENLLIGSVSNPERQGTPNFDWRKSKYRNKANFTE